MSRQQTIRAAAAAVIFTALSFGTAHAATVVFRDALKPNGHTRSQAAKSADAATCGMVPKRGISVILPVFEKCMAEKGWAFDHIRPHPKQRPRSGTNVNFTDVRGDANQHSRSGAVLQADARTRKAGHLDLESKRFKECMAAHGWQYLFAQRAPVRYRWAWPAEGWYSQWSNSSSSPGTSLEDDMRRIDESNAATQAASDAMNASIAASNAQQAADHALQNAIQNTIVNPQ
ncbi:MAG: hypothetical protein JO000_06335 [Alphaproteobacteria bacterium]|nr:hypothetical protein [Alphaproteobacteria bacterium]